MNRKFYPITRTKGEMPLYMGLFFFWLFSGLAVYPFGVAWNFVYALLIIGIIAILRKSGVAALNRKYFIQADETGIAYRLNIFSKETKLIWELIKDVDVLLYEINFRLESDGTVVSLALSGLSEEERAEVKEYIFKSFYTFKNKQESILV